MKQAINIVLLKCVCLLFFTGLSVSVQAADDTYEEDTILKEADAFFGGGAEGLAEVIEKIFKEQGSPNAFIKGQEASGAIVIGARYGDGTLVKKVEARPKYTGQGLVLVLVPAVIYPRFSCLSVTCQTQKLYSRDFLQLTVVSISSAVLGQITIRWTILSLLLCDLALVFVPV